MATRNISGYVYTPDGEVYPSADLTVQLIAPFSNDIGSPSSPQTVVPQRWRVEADADGFVDVDILVPDVGAAEYWFSLPNALNVPATLGDGADLDLGDIFSSSIVDPSANIGLTDIIDLYAVALAPATAARNFVIPSADVVPLTLRGHAGATARLQEWQLANGSVPAYVSASGVFTGSGAGLTGILTAGLASPNISQFTNDTGYLTALQLLTGAIVLNPATSARNIVQPTADAVTLTLRRFAGGVQDLQRWEGSATAKMTAHGSLVLPTTSSNTKGIIYKTSEAGTDAPFFHTYAALGSSGNNLFIGFSAGNFTLAPSVGLPGGPYPDGSSNIGIGFSALSSLQYGWGNVAVGVNTLTQLTTGQGNCAFGGNALRWATDSHDNAAFGADALEYTTTGGGNTACGTLAGAQNTTGQKNVFMGWGAGQRVVQGDRNVIIGYECMPNMSTGVGNAVSSITAIGHIALNAHLTGGNIVAIGDGALYLDTSGESNTAVGAFAGYTNDAANANLTGSQNTWIGSESGPGTPTQITQSIAIGYRSKATLSYQAVLGSATTTLTTLYPKVGIGTLTPLTEFHVTTTSFGLRGIMASQHDDTIYPSTINMRKSRGTNAVPLTVATGDQIGRIMYAGHDGTAYKEMAQILCGIEGTVDTDRVPTYLEFFTGSDTAPSSLTSRMKITSAGVVLIGATTPTTAVDRIEIIGDNTTETGANAKSLNRSLYTVTPPSASAGVYATIYGRLQLAATSANLTGSSFVMREELDNFNTGVHTLIGGITILVNNHAASGTITSLVGASSTVNNRSTGTVTTLVGYSSQLYNSGGTAIGTVIGYRLEAPQTITTLNTNFIGYQTPVMSTAAVNNCHVLLGQVAAPVGNYGIYSAVPYNSYLLAGLGIGNSTVSPMHASAMLQVDSITKGFLPPRMTGTQRDAIGTPAAGLVIYNTSTGKLNLFTSAWEAVTSV